MEFEAEDGFVAFEVVAEVHHLDGRLVAGSSDVALEDAPGCRRFRGSPLFPFR